MNHVALIGNLATDPELRTTGSGKAVASFRLAISRPGSDTADFVSVVAWEKTAQVVKEYLTKGRRVAVEGRLHHNTWKTEDGQSRSTIEIVANRVHMLGGPRQDADAPAEAVAPAVEAELDPVF